MKKTLNVSGVINELKGQSAYFRPSDNLHGTPDPTPPTERFSERNSERTAIRTESLPLKRRTKRYSFEFYDDQLSKLKRLKMQAEMRGEQLTLSDMAREAFDTYLKDR
jgi:hypothetical protein